MIAGTAMVVASTVSTVSAQKPTSKSPVLNTSFINKSIKPGDNFFRYANGNWYDTATISPTETGVGSFYDLDKSVRENIKVILESAEKTKAAKGSFEQLVGDFYASGMDTITINKLGYTPIKPILADLDKVNTIPELLKFIAVRERENGTSFFRWGIGADDKNSSQNIVQFSQGGLGLSDRDYYFKTDAHTLEIVNAYKTYLTKLFVLTGTDQATATKNAELIFDIEKQLASSHRTRVELRNPELNYNKIAISELVASEPNIGWKTLLSELGINNEKFLLIGQPAYYKKLDSMLTTVPVADWKVYMRAKTIAGAATYLSSDFTDAQFEYSKVISGQVKQKPRWEKIYGLTNGYLGDPLGKLYVDKYFTQTAKTRMDELVANLQKSFSTRINKLDWMSDSTKAIAQTKLAAFIKKIGYPTKWKDYSKVVINRNTFYDNVMSSSKNSYNRELAKLGKPVDKTEWAMTPPTINAYYNPSINEIVFPAGILQPPFFNPLADDAVNYGGIGMVIGHEMTHGFDDQGSQYDKEGNLKNWWGAGDKSKFDEKVKQVIAQYNSFTVLDSLHVNGALTVGENMADIGGIAIAYDAFKLTKQGQGNTKIDGLTPDQRFFLSFSQIWRIKLKEATVRRLIDLDPHSPAEWRVNGPLMNFTPFYNAFDVKPGEKMYKPEAERIKIW
ncbi:MAG: peptidase M13 [Pseudopedobacter saltans]|uniref:Peptidase M13 n=1 Tax=Pseudopedobacter saltans TaxID=151895 RepID=A0A2W5F9G5_9SPHI|nr:MAG: peptidase M13 [Pseudopedobacter saltans]